MAVAKARHNAWVKLDDLPVNYIYIEFNDELLSSEDRIWFNDLLIAGLYPKFDLIKRFAELLIGWNYPYNSEKLQQITDILRKRRKWELKEAFNYMLLGNVPPKATATNDYLIQLFDYEDKQKNLAVASYYAHFGKNHEKKIYQMILTNEVERKAIINGSYKYILYAFYVYRTYRYGIDTSLPIESFDDQVRNYFFNIEDTISGSKIIRLTAQDLYFRNIKQYVIELYAQGFFECFPLICVLQEQVPNYNLRNVGIPDVGRFKLLDQKARGGGRIWQHKVTPFQFLLGEICNTLRPNCVEALLGFKRYLLNMPWFCQSVINIGIEPWRDFLDVQQEFYRETGIILSVRGAFNVGGFSEEAPPQ